MAATAVMVARGVLVSVVAGEALVVRTWDTRSTSSCSYTAPHGTTLRTCHKRMAGARAAREARSLLQGSPREPPPADLSATSTY